MQKIKTIIITLILSAVFLFFLKYGIKLEFLQKFSDETKSLQKSIPIKILGKYKILLGSFKKKEDVESIKKKLEDEIVEDCEVKINKNSKGLYVLTIENIQDEETVYNINFRIRNICIGSIIKS